jgi:hypothetical protein
LCEPLGYDTMEARKLWQYVASNHCALRAKSVLQYKLRNEQAEASIALRGNTKYLNPNQEGYHTCASLQ